LKVMQDENARLAETVREQGKKLTFLEEEYKKLAGENQSLQQNSGAEKEAAKSRHKYLEKKISNLEKKIQKLERLIRDVGQAAAQEGKQKKRSAVRKEEPVDASVECVEHTVEKGHVLFNIAKAYHVSVQEIRKINNLKSDRLFIGQKLLIPVKKERE
ncbi:MAG: LysM peptidoglycan-binding domain-containing protein, partial [Lentisphaeria bacterium]|nr:LysM peptidoglycan-binding domain-containing protein [Lentisphaeria bacterium]